MPADSRPEEPRAAAVASTDMGVPEPMETADEPLRPRPRAHSEARGAAWAIIATLACLYALHWAAAVVVPLLLGLMGSYALKPIVGRMVMLGLPRTLAAALLMVVVLSGLAGAAYTLSDDAASLVQALPEAAQKLRRALADQRTRGAGGTIEKVQRAAAELERAAEEGARGASTTPPPRGVTKVQVERPAFNIKDYLWPGTLGLVTAIGQAIVVVLITFFLLASGDTFRRKLVRIVGPTFARKKLTLQALDEIDHQIQRYLLLRVFTSMLVGVATWLVFWWIGVERAAAWGVVAFVLNFIPYFGHIAFTSAAALTGFVQFGSFEMAALVAGSALLISGIEGYLLSPWLTGRAARMNSVAVFVGVLAWGWLWGIWGLFLGVPILMVIKAVCDRIEDLKGVGELLGD